MNDVKAIRLRDGLAETSRKGKDGKPLPFHIAFMSVDMKRKKLVERIELERAVRCGVPKTMRHNPYLIGIRVPHNSHHDYVVDIHLITQINHKIVS